VFAELVKRGRFQPQVFVFVTLALATLLVAIVEIPQLFSKRARLEVLRAHVAQVAQLAAAVVDGDLHRQLLDPQQYTPELYARALSPLVRFHTADPEIFYVYTMVDRGGKTYFVLDTAASPNLHANRKLQASRYLEPFKIRPQYESDWLQQIASGKTWVTPSFQEDDYGTFLTAHTPIYDSQHRYSGFVGVDFDLHYYLAEEERFRNIGLASLAAAVLSALLIGYLLALYHFDLHHRIDEHYRSSIRDGLTGLLNRRGALDAIGKSLARRTASYAVLLVDIDNLKTINDTKGHAVGDAVINAVAEAIRASIRDGDDCARLGGDEFMVFAPECDGECAADVARRILLRVSQTESGIPLGCTVSIGISVQAHSSADFDRMYRDADAALYRAKSEGKHRFTVHQA
jgi:diguanylate cyclase (GGDEF)-like protein